MPFLSFSQELRQPDVMASFKDDSYSDIYEMISHNIEYPPPCRRIKVHLNEIAPINPATNQVEYNFDSLDLDVNLLNEKGYTAAIQIMPDRAWFPFQQIYIDGKKEGKEWVYRQDEDGQFDYGWWNYTYMNGLHTMNTWRLVIYNVANRYRNANIRLIIFDEPCTYDNREWANCTNGDEFALTYDKAAEVYINAADVVKGYETLNHIPIGGFAGHKMQTSVLADRMFTHDNGSYDKLDFIAMNIFLGNSNDFDVSGNYGNLKEDRRFNVLNRAVQFEELALNTLAHNSNFDKELMIDSYNVFGASSINGSQISFPSNKDHFGAIYQTLAQLHAFKGGVDVMLKWNVIANSGVFSGGYQGAPIEEKNPTYYAWDFTHNVIELKEGNSIFDCSTQEEALGEEYAEHMSNYSFLDTLYKKDVFKVQPFAILTEDGGVNVVLINKYGSGISRFVKIPPYMSNYKVYKFVYNENDENYDNAFNIHSEGIIVGEYSLNVYCHPESITVVKFFPNIGSARPIGNNSTLVQNDTLFKDVYIYNLNGVLIKKERTNNSTSEMDLYGLNRGLYIVKIVGENNKIITKKIFVDK